ncbi:hypothetical protein Pmar_PMAR019658 [Perkinsus marinus ATCC 50983]|uniref:Uncharacterized protein n=1 Tax=Perkinsus marinus (strain ATCC 50983 / TXsc) TaxID=423536 RepID=C5LFA9_PERM5|nr:hypothetical protein Pmar_PMAR019658 [Perkinsus marinus ATCC 50983]EER04624.1 hypothetical protein Pmar_PMAR019658 [Perkinsus marinus ATCC 50983]|eukprot:XP_002772808.1 hypothetical protein Pmar_PMAR019658 [Perkinsus marinus ATCC 50983]
MASDDKTGNCCCRCKPWVFFILSAVSVIIAVICFVIAIVAMVPFYNAFIDGINYGRFIDNTYQTTDCENMVAGDATCGGKAYDAWLMSSDELYNTCMSDQEPSSSAVALDSAWCDASSDDCSKDMCQKGMQYDYYAYNLTNPEEVLKGAKPIVQELTPVHTAMSITKTSPRLILTFGIRKFVKLTVGELLGFQDQSKVDKVSGMPLTMALSATTNPVTEQYRASFVEDWKGLYYFKMSNGMEYNCAFDPDCMAQDEFKANGTCTPDDKCHPNYAAGFDVKYVPGTLNGHGTNDYHKVGAIDKMFVSPVFSTAQMKLSKKDQDYNGANIDIWDLADLAFRNENCDGSGDDSRGIDCDSPYLTLNLGTFSSPKPNLVRTPIYASLPHFYQVDGSSSVRNWYPGDRVDTKSCSGSEECDDPERDFNCQMWTEPITGALLKGALKLQMNVMMPPAANTESGKLTDEVLIPAVWVDEHQLAYPYQIDSIKQLQAAPGLFELVMWLGIAFGIVFVLCAVAFFYFGWRRRSALRAVVLQKKVSGVTEAL